MAVTIEQYEGEPDENLSGVKPAIWQRIEAWCAHRWTPREVVWIVEGPGEWVPPLTPATVTIVEIWSGGEWTEAFPAPSPLGGFMLHGKGPYRITAEVGADNPPPEIVLEAYDRLDAYLAAEAGGVPGASSYSMSVGSDISESIKRRPDHVARAIHNSGAADLLRQYRRA